MKPLIIALLIAATALAEWLPGPDLDAPHVYHKACIYCQNCTPVCETMDTNDCYYFSYADSEGNHLGFKCDTSYYENGFVAIGGTCDCYRCQRTGKRMVFDSVGVVEWGVTRQLVHDVEYFKGDTIRCGRPDEPEWETNWKISCSYTLIVADTSGIVRIE